jgi:hypothetical protein
MSDVRCSGGEKSNANAFSLGQGFHAEFKPIAAIPTVAKKSRRFIGRPPGVGMVSTKAGAWKWVGLATFRSGTIHRNV